MPKFMIKAIYTAEGIKGLKKDTASGREKAIAAACEAMGGKLDALYYALGDDYVFAIVDLPSHVPRSVARFCGRGKRMGGDAVAEMDKALGEEVKYRPPGG